MPMKSHAAELSAEAPVPSPAASASHLLPLLVSATDLAQLLRVSLATIWRLRAAGKLPRPATSLGRQLLRWQRSEIESWVEAGMPDLQTWEKLKT
jgi:predicted DNA-binding transcriptional regulator AlpA